MHMYLQDTLTYHLHIVFSIYHTLCAVFYGYNVRICIYVYFYSLNYDLPMQIIEHGAKLLQTSIDTYIWRRPSCR
jgi:hypothetical protein